jgi:hypothetical protein
LSLIPATASLLGFLQFPARSPRRDPQLADFSDFGAGSGIVAEILPVTREFAPLEFARARRP